MTSMFGHIVILTAFAGIVIYSLASLGSQVHEGLSAIGVALNHG